MALVLNPEMQVEEIVEQFPQLVKVLTVRGIICIQCGAPTWGTLRELIESTGQNIDDVMAELLDALSKE